MEGVYGLIVCADASACVNQPDIDPVTRVSNVLRCWRFLIAGGGCASPTVASSGMSVRTLLWGCTTLWGCMRHPVQDQRQGWRPIRAAASAPSSSQQLSEHTYVL